MSTNRALLISVYPYLFWGVGLCLVLWFMALTPICVLRPPVVMLPFSPEAPTLPEVENQIAVTIRSNGELFLDRRYVTRAELARFTAELVSRAPRRSFLLRADARLPFSEIRAVIAALRESGVTSVQLITQD